MGTWVIALQWGARGILIILLALSVWSVAIIIDRRRAMKEFACQEGHLNQIKTLIHARDWGGLKKFLDQTQSQKSIYNRILLSAMETGSASSETIERAVKSTLTTEKMELEKGLTALATLGSNAPFIGLFGTVLGIIQVFAALGEGSSANTSVMKGISEALVATAVGLFVAIPAVIAYNFFSRKLRLILAHCSSLIDYYISKKHSQLEG